MINKDCDFCNELNGKNTVFNEIYGDMNRIIMNDKNFFMIPSLGQLRSGHILIINKKHKTAAAQLDEKELNELSSIIERLTQFYKEIYESDSIFFEHGMMTEEGGHGGCGISHLHIHALPINDDELQNFIAKIKAVSNYNCYQINSFKEIQNLSKEIITYLLVKASESSYMITTPRNEFPSQQLRKLLCECIGNEKWNWKENLERESELVETYSKGVDYFAKCL